MKQSHNQVTSATLSSYIFLHKSPFYLHYIEPSSVYLSLSPRKPNKLNVLNYCHVCVFLSGFPQIHHRLWNCLPPVFTSITCLPEFKHPLFQYFCPYIHYTDGIPAPDFRNHWMCSFALFPFFVTLYSSLNT